MKHLPNLLTLANLFCGCTAIAYILTAQPQLSLRISDGLPTWSWVYGAQQIAFGCMFIGIAAVCDMLDGAVARALNVFSPIGKDLDSLADVVSFGVAPSVILFKYLWDAQMGEKNALDASMISMVPAFLVACFAALRLAKYNITSTSQKSYFIGMPTPAVGLFVASLPLVTWYNPYNAAHYLQNKWTIYALIVLLCWLMVSQVRFIKMIPAKMSIGSMWPQLLLIVVGVAGWFFFHVLVVPVVFLLYIVLSVINKPDEAVSAAQV